MKCSSCGGDNRENSKFCSQCGNSLSVIKKAGHLSSRSILAGRYEIVKLVKSGGMGSVYEAIDRHFEDKCAVKEMFPKFNSSKQEEYVRKRFEEEAKLLRKLHHNNLPRVVDYFTEKGMYYLVMDFIEGKDLQTILKKEGNPGLPEKNLKEWALQILGVLTYLHSQLPPVIYRDLKPSNIMIRKSDNKAVVIDFGIARTIQTEEQIAKTKTAIGTVGYMSPEQYRGKPVPQSDIYSLGATMYHLLTGKQPIPFTYPSLRKEKPEISEKTDAVVMKSVKLKPEERFRTAEEMKEAIAGKTEMETPEKEEAKKIDEAISQLNTVDRKERKEIVKNIVTLKTERLLKPLLKVAREDEDPEIRKIALDSLVTFPLNTEIEETLKHILLKDSSSVLRASAAQAAGNYNDNRLGDSLLESLDDSNEDVRIETIMALVKMGEKRAIEKLLEIAKKERGRIKEKAISAIEVIEPEKIKELDEEDVKTEKEEISRSSSETTGEIKNKNSAGIIISIIILIILSLVLFKYGGIQYRSYQAGKIDNSLSEGFEYINSSSPEKARESFEQARILSQKLSLVSREAMALYGIGLSYYLEENRGKTIEYMEKSVKYDKKLGGPYLYLGNTYVNNDNKKAIDNLEKAKEIMPARSDVYISLIYVYHISGNPEKALSIIEEARKKLSEINNDKSFKNIVKQVESSL